MDESFSVLETVNNPDPDSFDPNNTGKVPKTLRKRVHNSLMKNAELTRPTAAHPFGGPVAGAVIGTSGMPLTACGRERPPDPDACKQAPRSWVS